MYFACRPESTGQEQGPGIVAWTMKSGALAISNLTGGSGADTGGLYSGLSLNKTGRRTTLGLLRPEKHLPLLPGEGVLQVCVCGSSSASACLLSLCQSIAMAGGSEGEDSTMQSPCVVLADIMSPLLPKWRSIKATSAPKQLPSFSGKVEWSHPQLARPQSDLTWIHQACRH